MICYVHLQEARGREEAVAVCQTCGVALCMEHLADLHLSRPGGMDIGCTHVMPATRTHSESSTDIRTG